MADSDGSPSQIDRRRSDTLTYEPSSLEDQVTIEILNLRPAMSHGLAPAPE
jgi:hypothetical protein